MARKTYSGYITSLLPNQVFVFGSNPQGRHGLGAALVAKKYFGAKYGQARGLMGQSYGIVTKDLTKHKHPSVDTKDIKREIAALYAFAEVNKQLEFFVSYSGKGKLLSGFTPEQMARMFATAGADIPDNIVFEEAFAQLIESI